MIKPNPFTPKSGIEPKYFVNREEELKTFLRKIEEAKRGEVSHFVINGEWGIGKTSLLKYLKIIAQERNCLAVYFPTREFPSTAKDDEIVLHILQSIARSAPFRKKKSKFLTKLKGFGIQVFGTGISLEFSKKRRAIDAQNLLIDGLSGIWQDIKNKTSLLVVLIDDTQNWKEVTRIFSLVKNVLSSDEIINRTKYLFVLTSTTEGWKQFSLRNHPIGRFFIPRIDLKKFDKKSTIKLINKFLEDTSVIFDRKIKDLVYEFTEGHLFEIHALCSALYNEEINGKVTASQWNKVLNDSLIYLAEAVFKSNLQLPEREKEVLSALSYFNKPTKLNQISRKCKKLKFGIKNINQHIRRLLEKKIIQSYERGLYFIEDRLFREYIKKSNI